MMRLLGILVGFALAVAMLVFLVGVPQMRNESRFAPIGDNGIIRLPKSNVAEPTAQTEPEPEPSLPVVNDAAGEPVEEIIATAAAESAVESIDVREDMRQWYAFWSPFRTEIAATGFITRLQRVTGLDYRVVKIEAGVYEVAFAYSDDDEIMSNLSQISAATGLRLPEN